MANTKLKLNQIQQDGASTNDVITWNGSAWAPATNGTGTVTSVAATQPAAGLTISGSPITSSGTLTFALANDLAGLEGLSSTGLAVRTGDGTWNTRSITLSASSSAFVGIGSANTDGVSGNPTFTLNTNNATNKLFVQAVATTNITKSGTQTIDGVSLSAGQRVLLTGQTNSQENGIWDVSAGTWTRSADADTSAKWDTGILVHVKLGTTNGATYWKLDTKGPFTVDTTPLTFSKVFTSSADGNGIYSGSGNIASAAVATVGSGSSFTIDYNGGADAIKVSDATPSTYIKSKDTNQTVEVSNSAVSLSAGSNSVTLTSTGFDVSTGVGGPYISTNGTDISLTKGSTQFILDSTDVGVFAPYFYIIGEGSSTQGELRLYERSSAGSNYTAFKTQDQASSITYNLPATSTDGLMINSSSTLSWGTATNAHLGSGVGGIYKGSGTIPDNTVATLVSSGAFEIVYSNTNTALGFNDASGGASFQSKANAHQISVDDTNIVLSAPFTLLDSIGASAQELRFQEPSGANYTAFKAQAQTADITYTLPAAAPASNGYVLSSTTGGTLSWVANGGADGNGIYTGSGTIASNAVATLTSGASFTIDFNGGNNAMWINDSTGAILIYDKTANCGIGMDNAGIGLYSGSDSFVLDESSGGAALNTDLRIYNGKLLLDSVSTPSQFTSNQNNFALSATAAVLRVSTDASRNLTGIANSGTMQDGRVLTIVNVGSNNIVLTTEDTNSTAANRFALGESNVTLKASESLTVWYDTTTDRWRPISYQASTGASDGNGIYTGSGTIASGAVATLSSSAGFFINYNGGNNAIQFVDSTGASTISSKDATSYVDVANGGVTIASGADFNTLSGAYTKIIGNSSSAQADLRLYERSSAGSNYTSFVTQDQSASITYTLPAAVATLNGQVLTSTTGGTLTWSSVSDTYITAAPSTDVTASGEKIQFLANENQAFGDVVYIASDGDAAIADADAIATAKVVAMCIGTVTTGNTGTYLLKGIARNDAWNWTVGGYVYLSTTGTTGNTLTQTAPSGTDDCVVIIGIATHADRILFNPSYSITELN